MKKDNKKAMQLAVVAGILLLISGVSGAAAWSTVEDFVTENISDSDAIQMVFVVLILIASLGGLIVILGGAMIGKKKVGPGKALITLGAGLGLIGLIVSVVVGLMEGSIVIFGFFAIGGVGLILSIIARAMAEKKPKRR